MKFYDLIWLIPLFPLVGAIVNGLVTNRLGLKKSVTNTVALTGSGLAWLWAWAAVVAVVFQRGPRFELYREGVLVDLWRRDDAADRRHGTARDRSILPD